MSFAISATVSCTQGIHNNIIYLKCTAADAINANQAGDVLLADESACKQPSMLAELMTFHFMKHGCWLITYT
jgi:hypothetical protein